MCEYCVACCVCIRLREDGRPNRSPSDVIHQINGRDCECMFCNNSFCEYHWRSELDHGNTVYDAPYLIAKCMDCEDNQ